MRAWTVVLFAILLAGLGLLTVHAEVERVRAGYRIARLTACRERLTETLAALKAEHARLVRPARLEALNRELDLGLRPVTPARTSLAARSAAPNP